MTQIDNTIDHIMDKDPLELTKDDISTVVAYYRRQREAGPRPKKEKGPEPKIELQSLGLGPAPVAPIHRRV